MVRQDLEAGRDRTRPVTSGYGWPWGADPMVPLALFSFNVGVELGQLIFIAVVLVAIHLVQRVYELPRQAVVASAYVIGTIAAFWSIDRFDSMFM
ncbi:MAG: HupE/UreJ family protein [Mesorhizobium sp.]|nr:MAG: hypothetical protein EOS00_14370 [Mesorhizobium sp.]TIL28846.1 MAG: HupE/UreJ family protein [Mesorhizobium sp.]TIN07844.1 MAG: HupE/UreJ family protein [Mesorhizobium sp.]